MQYSLNDFNTLIYLGFTLYSLLFGFICIFLSWIYTRILHGIGKRICIFTWTYTRDFKEVFLCVLLILHFAKILFTLL